MREPRLLAINHLFFLHVEGDHREFADARVAPDGPQDGDQGAGVQGCSAADREFCGAKFTSTFTFSGSVATRWTGGSSLNCSQSAR